MPDADYELHAEEMLEVLTRHAVHFVVIGGFAAIAHGSPFPTEDVDITPEATVDNLGRLSAALRELEARICTDAVPGGLPLTHDAQSLAAAGVWNLETKHGDLDISMVPSGTAGYHDLSREAERENVGAVVVSLASLADVIRSKQAANRLKDQRVLPTLRRILAERHQRPD